MNGVNPNQSNNCNICLDDVTNNLTDSNRVETKCNHIFHKNCLTTWLVQNNRCPTCRSPDPIFHQLSPAPSSNQHPRGPVPNSNRIVTPGQNLDPFGQIWNNFFDSPHQQNIHRPENFTHTNVREGYTFTQTVSNNGENVSIRVRPTNENTFSAQRNRCQNAKSGIQGLQQILGSLSGNIENVRRLIQELESRSIECIFPITSHGSEAKNCVGTVFFHIYHIHLKETPGRLKNDFDYGRKAFLNLNDFSSENNERLRCLQRVIIEMALEGLKNALESGSNADIREFLDILESFQVHEKDRPDGKEKITHFLFNAIYQNYKQDQERNRNLIHPHDPVFRNDFGRVVFRNEVNHSLSLEDKMVAICELHSALMHAWKISLTPTPNTSTVQTTTQRTAPPTIAIRSNQTPPSPFRSNANSQPQRTVPPTITHFPNTPSSFLFGSNYNFQPQGIGQPTIPNNFNPPQTFSPSGNQSSSSFNFEDLLELMRLFGRDSDNH